MPPAVQPLIDVLGPTWQHQITLAAAVLFLIGLLVERMWWLHGLRRDVAEIKKDLPQMKKDIETAQKTAEDAKTQSEMTAAAVEQSMQVIDRLHDAVLMLPQTIVAAMAARG